MVTSASWFMPAYAKINLTLAVIGRRADGFHELVSLMQSISLCDSIHLTLTHDGEVTCATDVPALRDDNNLAKRAAWLAMSARAEGADEGGGVALELRKRVPLQAGLGGGSSDAAAVLTALNGLWRMRLSAERLDRLAAVLGSDVPFFMRGGTCLVTGRGERVRPLPDVEPLWLVLVKPAITVSTTAVFRALAPTDYHDDTTTRLLMGAIRSSQPLPFELLSNALEPPVLRDHPAVAAAREALLAAGASCVRMSGSGPTLYAPFRALVEASAVAARARAAGLDVWLCHTVSRETIARARPNGWVRARALAR